MIDGKRWSIPGDYCLLHADGSITLLGRGSVCINTAGEKVYPGGGRGGAEAACRRRGALVVGVPDEKWGSAVTAVVELAPGAGFDESALAQRTCAQLAGLQDAEAHRSLERNVPRAERQGGLQGGDRFRTLDILGL